MSTWVNGVLVLTLKRSEAQEYLEAARSRAAIEVDGQKAQVERVNEHWSRGTVTITFRQVR